MNYYMRKLFSGVISGMLVLCFAGCRIAEEKPAGFVNPQLMRPCPEETAFRREYVAQQYSPDAIRKVYVMPVVFTNNLENSFWEDVNIRNMLGWQDDDLKDLVDYAYVSMRNAVGEAEHFTPVMRPGPDVVNIELALVKVVPGKPVYHAGMLFLVFPVGPLLDAGINALSGNSFSSICAMECRITDGQGRLLMGLADNEKNKAAILNLLNFTAYGNHRQIIDEWAANIVKKMTAKPGENIPAPSVFVLIDY